MTDWFSDETFWETFYPFLFTKERFELAEEQVDKILGLTGLQGGSILDLACGPGRHSLALARKGFRVTGVDLSPFLLERAREQAEAAGVEVEWVRSDMRDFSRPDSFDFCLNMYTSFGYFENKEDDLKVLKNIYDGLVEGGGCLIDVLGKEWLAQHFQPTSSNELENGTLIIERREIYEDWSRIRAQWILVRGGTVTDHRFQHTIYSAQELKDRLIQVGFKQAQAYGDLDGNEYGREAKRLIVVAWK